MKCPQCSADVSPLQKTCHSCLKAITVPQYRLPASRPQPRIDMTHFLACKIIGTVLLCVGIILGAYLICQFHFLSLPGVRALPPAFAQVQGPELRALVRKVFIGQFVCFSALPVALGLLLHSRRNPLLTRLDVPGQEQSPEALAQGGRPAAD